MRDFTTFCLQKMNNPTAFGKDRPCRPTRISGANAYKTQNDTTISCGVQKLWLPYMVILGLTELGAILYNDHAIFVLGGVFMFKVKKRDSSIVEFNLSKIKAAISAAFEATTTPYTDEVLDMLTLRVTADFGAKVVDGVVSVEDIQDSVEVVLIQTNYVNVAKAYILYRKQHESIRRVADTIIN